jgi:hypothetical protein
MYEKIETSLIIITFISFLTINTYVFHELITNQFKKLPKKSRLALVGLSFLTSPTLIYIGLIFDSHLLWVSLHIIAYSYLIYLKKQKLGGKCIWPYFKSI